MSITTFNRADLAVTATAATLYGPVPVGTVAVVFSGTISNVDSTAKALHTCTVNILNGATVINRIKDIPIAYGSTSSIPKMVVKAGETVSVSADGTGGIFMSIEVLEVAG